MRRRNQETVFRVARGVAITAARMHIYEVRPRKDRRGFDLISDALPFGRLWYGEPNAITNAIGLRESFAVVHMVP